MRLILSLAGASLWSRRGSVLLTVLSVATSFALLIAVERLRTTTRSSFESTISGTDFLLGARGSEIQLLLYSVFRIGEPVPAFKWASFEKVAAHPEVSWAVPLALGDSVRGFRALGTSPAYFERYRYGDKQPLRLSSGRTFDGEHTAVLGSEVAGTLQWSVGSTFSIQHGLSEDALAHDHARFEVVGILAPTGTPVDRTVHIPLAGLADAHQPDPEEEVEAEEDMAHVDDDHHADHDDGEHDGDEAHAEVEALETVSAAMVGLRSKMGLFKMRAWIGAFSDEPLMAVMPARAFQRLWATVGVAERALRIIGLMVSMAGIIALVATLLATVQARRREMALLRSVGASPLHIAVLIVGEASIIAFASAVTAFAAVYAVGLLGRTTLARYGLQWAPTLLRGDELFWVGAFVATAVLVSLIPAVVSYRSSLADGLWVRS